MSDTPTLKLDHAYTFELIDGTQMDAVVTDVTYSPDGNIMLVELAGPRDGWLAWSAVEDYEERDV